MDKIRILAIDDDHELLDYLPVLLGQEGEVLTAATCEEGLEIIRTKLVDLIIVDLNLEGSRNDGLFLLNQVSKSHPNLPLIVLSGDTLTKRVVEATRFNLVEFIPKTEKFYDSLTRAVKKGIERRQRFLSRVDVFETRSPKMRILLDEVVSRITGSHSESPILIEGETGCGKEIMAKHIATCLKKTLFNANMAAIPEALAESELFGSEVGAYTGAAASRAGLILQANHNIFFLDEIGETSLPIQAKLLRTIAEHEVKPVGAAQPKHAKVRFLAATNRDLNRMVEDGHFRQDLLERLRTFRIQILPLRERPEDIVFYANRFLNDFSPAKQFFLSKAGMDALLDYSWPSNVRELRNTIERIIVLAPSRTIGAEEVRKAIEMGGGVISSAERQRASQLPSPEELVKTLQDFNGNRRRAARTFGVHYVTFLRWLKAFGLEDAVPGRVGRPRVLPLVAGHQK